MSMHSKIVKRIEPFPSFDFRLVAIVILTWDKSDNSDVFGTKPALGTLCWGWISPNQPYLNDQVLDFQELGSDNKK